MEFLWSWWYGLDYDANSGFAAEYCHQVGFMDGDDAFNPADVLHAVHLIPCFTGPQQQDLLGPSMSQHTNKANADYERYYVGMFVDRDIFVQFTGGGIGHHTTHEATQLFQHNAEEGFSTTQATSASEDETSDTEGSQDTSMDSNESSGLESEDEEEEDDAEDTNEDEDEEDEDTYFEESLGYEDL
ncbi:hypothetical protein J132_02453 [Termitomyces sp. J132]|nr:hypothetical protein J132_02453 [Termitomyces sp. J132]